MVSPGRATTSWPSRKNLMPSMNGFLSSIGSSSVTGRLAGIGRLRGRRRGRHCKVVAEMFQHLFDRVHGGLAKTANRRVGHNLRELVEQGLVPARLLHDVDRLFRADAARCALAAALVLEKSQEVERHGAHVV